MSDRARMFTTNDVQDDSMMPLGKLAACLASELSNLASAVSRGAG